MEVDLSVETVVEVVQTIFSTMIDLEARPTKAAGLPQGSRVTSSVYLEGSWNGAVSVECGLKDASFLAGKFLAVDPPESFDDDVRDAMGELANVIGGNLKATMGTDVRLSMPSVIHGSDYQVNVCGSVIHDRIAFEFEGGFCWVTVLSKDGKESTKQHSKVSQNGTI